ncbi:uncharacterized protein BO96DRAFT_239806 [Aspergillus niger CBS 101883]|uniref:uncharacterized protein n=1 Tax=Aspergillus lacticoffeatus (strain CBS 101883) TaxID=1450533 RepID=UPI000D80352F|nr:uncharacterized protein BO96DRAFT_239806 [Aspergillus niger CBS 101883]PYH58393.1 hypothetical protein BO96DRAFT_239806 [Aspergillus niger CBS 101883]
MHTESGFGFFCSDAISIHQLLLSSRQAGNLGRPQLSKILASLASHIDRFRLLLVPGINYILFGTLYHLTYIHIHIFVSPSFFTLSQHNGRSTSGDHRFSR